MGAPKNVAYFGPENTNTHAAALSIFGDGPLYVPQLTKTGVFDAVAAGDCEVGVVPVENSTEGVVRETVDCLVSKSVMIAEEFEMSIVHCLMTAPGGATPTRILSHPQPLAQCRAWLEKNYPHLPRETAASTASAAASAAQQPGTLAIATSLAAASNGLEILQENISDRQDNATRFICVAQQDSAPTGRDKTTLVFTTPHEQGALLRVLGVLDKAGVNLMRIESRPLPGRRWEYAFVVDIEGHRLESPAKEALEQMEALGCLAKVIGSYPRTDAPPSVRNS